MLLRPFKKILQAEFFISVPLGRRSSLQIQPFLNGYFSKWVSKFFNVHRKLQFLTKTKFFSQGMLFRPFKNFCKRNFLYLSPEDVGAFSKLKKVSKTGGNFDLKKLNNCEIANP